MPIPILVILSLTVLTLIIRPRSSNFLRTIVNPAVVFCSSWSLICVLSYLQLFNLFSVNDKTYWLIATGVLGFTTAHYIVVLFLKENDHTTVQEIQYSFRTTIIYIFSTICIVYFATKSFYSLVELIHGNTFETIRRIAQTDLDSTPINNFIYNFVVLPSSMAIQIIAVVDFWKKRRPTNIFLINIIIIALQTLGDGGRTPIMNLVLYMILGFSFFTSRKEEKKKKKKGKAVFLLILFLVMLVYITFSRSSYSVFRQLYFYFSMAPVQLQYWTSYVESIKYFGNGLVSLNGFIFPALYILKNITFSQYPSTFQKAYDLISQTDSVWIPIANGQTKANAYVSAFWFLYVDGREILIFIGMFLYGALCTYIFLRAMYNPSIYWMSYYYLLFQGLFFSFIRFPFAKAYYVLAVAYILLFINKSTKKTYEIELPS